MDIRLEYIKHVLNITNLNTDYSTSDSKSYDDSYSNSKSEVTKETIFNTFLGKIELSRLLYNVEVISFEEFKRNNQIDKFLE